MASPLTLPWQVNGTAPRRVASPGAGRSGSPLVSGWRSQTVTSAPSSREAVEDRRVGDLGHEDLAGAARRCARRPRQRARRSRSWRLPAAWRGGRRSPAISSSSSVPNRWRALCEPETLPVSSLTHTPPCPANAEASLKLALRSKGVTRNPAPSTRARSWSSRSMRSDHVSIGPARGTCGVIGVQERAVADEGIRLARRCGKTSATAPGHDAGRGRYRRRAATSGSQGAPVRPRRGDSRSRSRRRRSATTGEVSRSSSRVGAPADSCLRAAPLRRVELVDQRVPASGAARGIRPRWTDRGERRMLVMHALLLDPGVVAQVEDPSTVSSVSSSTVSVVRTGQVLHRHAAAAAEISSKPPGKSRPMTLCSSLAYIGAPSVATVRSTSSGPRPCGARDLDGRHARCRCSRGPANRAARAAPAPRRAGRQASARPCVGVEEDVELIRGPVADTRPRSRCS